MLCNIAEINVEVCPDEMTRLRLGTYAIDGGIPEFTVAPETIESYNMRKPVDCNFKAFQYLTCGSSFYRQLINYNGIPLHSSAVVYDNKAYLFSAPSGTGKSTHTGFWLDLFGADSYILNDDKPAIRCFADGVYAYGTPWSGKHDISANKKVPLQGICFISRDNKNWIKQMDPFIASTRIYHAAMKRLTDMQATKEIAIINDIISRVPIWEMGCLPNIDAAKMAYEAMSKAEVK